MQGRRGTRGEGVPGGGTRGDGVPGGVLGVLGKLVKSQRKRPPGDGCMFTG